MHANKGTSGNCELTQNIPASIFQQEVLRALTELNALRVLHMRASPHAIFTQVQIELYCT